MANLVTTTFSGEHQPFGRRVGVALSCIKTLKPTIKPKPYTPFKGLKVMGGGFADCKISGLRAQGFFEYHTVCF